MMVAAFDAGKYKNDPKPGKNGEQRTPLFQRVIFLFSPCYFL
jgi:hypothetical protein